MTSPAAVAARSDGPAPVQPPTALARPVDLDRATRAAGELLDALGLDRGQAGLADTPRRVAAMLGELLTPMPFQPTTFPNDAGYDELVLVSEIRFTSLCEHHLLPFRGVVLEAEHLCMSIRGVRSEGARTVTSTLYGLLRDRPAARQEFLQLARTS